MAEQVTFNARLSPEVKARLQRAAELRGQSLTDFVVGAAYERATETIEQDQVLRLTERDSDLFAQAIEQPAAAQATIVKRFVDAHRKSASRANLG